MFTDGRFPIPTHDCDQGAFEIVNDDMREAALAWAFGVIADAALSSDNDMIRACKTILANHPNPPRSTRRLLEICEANNADHINAA